MRCARTVPIKLVRAASPFSAARFTVRRSTVSSSSLGPRKLRCSRLGCESRIHALVGCSWPCQDCPGNACDLVCKSNDDFVRMHANGQPIEPCTESIAAAIKMEHTGSRAVNEQTPHIRITPLADAHKVAHFRDSSYRPRSAPGTPDDWPADRAQNPCSIVRSLRSGAVLGHDGGSSACADDYACAPAVLPADRGDELACD